MALDVSNLPGAVSKISPAPDASSGLSGGGGPAAPGASDVRRFQDALEGPPRPEAASSAPPPPEGAAAGGSVLPPGAGMGDRILAGLSGASQKIQEGRATAVQALGAENVSQADLLKANFALIESSTLVSAVSKTAEKITQGLKTLQQG